MKKVKFILPVVAIMFAVAGVFATGNSTSALVPVDATLGYLAPTPNCTIDGECSNDSGATCTTTSGVIVKKREANGTCPTNALGDFTYYN